VKLLRADPKTAPPREKQVRWWRACGRDLGKKLMEGALRRAADGSAG